VKKRWSKWLPRDEPVNPEPFKNTDYLCGLFVLFTSFGVYLHTLAPTVTSGDVGDHIVCSYILSIPHPTGYPLYILLGNLFCQIPIGNIALRMNLLSAIFGALSVMVIFFLTRRLCGSISLPKLLTSIFSSFLFGFSWVFWSQCLVAEVYTLNIFFISLILLLLISLRKKSLFLIGFILGIGLSHHLSLLFIVPGTVFFIFTSERKHLLDLKVARLTFLFFTTGLLLWLYLPIVSARDPFLSWGNITGIKELFYFATGKEFTSKHLFTQYSSEGVRWLSSLIFDQFLFLLALSPFGLWYIAKRSFRLLIFFSSTIIVDILFSLNYHIYDIEVYYLPTFLLLSIMIGCGILEILQMIDRRLAVAVSFGALGLLSIPLRTYHSVNMNDYHHIYDYARSILKTASERAIIFDSSHVGYFSLWYLLVAEQPEREVCVIPNGWLSKPWTIERFRKRHPWLKAKLENEPKNRDGLYYNIQSVYEKMLRKNIDSVPIYYVYGSGELKSPYPIIEEGILSTHQNTSTKPFEYPHRTNKRGYKDYWARVGASVFHNNLGNYYYRSRKYEEAMREFEIAATADPKHIGILSNFGALSYLNRRYEQAYSVFQRILQIDPNNTYAKNMLKECRKILDRNKGVS
jgi:tetratricopeptide (TPR) repeat protein